MPTQEDTKTGPAFTLRTPCTSPNCSTCARDFFRWRASQQAKFQLTGMQGKRDYGKESFDAACFNSSERFK